MTNITIAEDLWEDNREGVIVTWIYQDGATVEAGKVVVELGVEKTQLEIVAPASGKLKILVAADAVVTRGQVIGTVD